MPGTLRALKVCSPMLRVVLFLFVATLVTPPEAFAEDKPAPTRRDRRDRDKDKDKDAKPAPPPKEPRKPGPSDAKVTAVLEKIVAGPDSAAREKAIAELIKLTPEAIDAVGEWVIRTHQHEVADRKKVLVGIKAAVPDKSGKFTVPWSRPSNKELQADDDVDWLKALLDSASSDPAAGEVIADVAAIRALAASKDIKGAQYIFDAAFAETSMVYRDECGRYLRKMEPYSIPALTRESMGRNADRRRYATWQLERLDRQDAAKALGAAKGDEGLQVAILDVFRETHHREAVHAVWAHVDASSNLVREAARRAWMDYITGPPPPPAPRQKLKLPGGKETKFPKPLWLTYRELADNELRKAANELLHEDYPLEEAGIGDSDKPVKLTPIDLEDVTKRLFAYYDGERKKRDGKQWDAAKALSDKGDVAGASKLLDQLVAINPDRAERVEMAKVYVAHAKQLETANKWAEASAAYSKAYGLDPKKTSLAAQHFTLGKSLEAAGKDGGTEYRRAVALDPEYAPAKSAAEKLSAPSRAVWMLYAAIGAAGLAVLLFGAAMLRRRAA
jgi:tetratricopeptide (TPR) repeat protein